MDYIDKDEKELLESFERNEWVTISNSKKAEIEETARNNTKKINELISDSPKKIITIFR